MLSLHDIQIHFVNALRTDDNDILQYIQPSNRLSAQAQLAIYQNSIIGAKQKALSEIYPVCMKLVGEDFFIAMINHYIPTTMSTCPDLSSYGGDFYKFVADFAPSKSLSYLSDVARLEWAWHKLYSTLETKKIDFPKLADCYATSGEDIIFILSANSTLITSSYPLHLIWQQNRDDYESEQIIVLPENESFNYFVWKKGQERRIDILSLPEWQMLEYISRNFTIGKILEQSSLSMLELNLEEMLPKIVANGWVVDFKIASATDKFVEIR